MIPNEKWKLSGWKEEKKKTSGDIVGDGHIPQCRNKNISAPNAKHEQGKCEKQRTIPLHTEQDQN